MPKVVPVKSFSIESKTIDAASLIYRALYHPLRLQMIGAIHADGEMIVSKLIKKFRLEQAVASQQLGILRRASILTTRREGRMIFYAVNYKQLNRIIRASKRLVPERGTKTILNKIKPMNLKIGETKTTAFSEKELLIIQLICDQKTNEEIAQKLTLSKRTVESYRDAIIKRMKVKNTAGLVVYAIRQGFYEVQ